MPNIVITGSTRGIGYGLADAFLALGCRVAISGRTQEAVAEALAALEARHGADRLLGHPCDVRECAQVQALWDAVQAHWGQIDIWINNAGLGQPQQKVWECAPDEVRTIVDTNIVGTMHGARVAVQGMLRQGHGSLYNLEGLGSDGRQVDGVSIYGTTKAAVRYLTDALIRETKGTPVLVGALRPGMVVTELLTGPYADRPDDWERARPIFNILADRVETIAPWFARQILANRKSGRRIRWMGPGKMLLRFLTAPLAKRDVFSSRE